MKKNTTPKIEYVIKLLGAVRQNSNLFKEPEINFILGLTSKQVADVKRYAIAENLISENKKQFSLTFWGDKYLQDTLVAPWTCEEFPERPEINLEYLKEEKAQPALTKAIRELARCLISDEELKENSTVHYLIKELLCTGANCYRIRQEIEGFILQGGEINLSRIFTKYMIPPYGLTKAIVSILLLDILVKNKDVLAVYEQGQFQLGLDPLMFDRIVYAPQNFEIQKAVIEEIPVLGDISEIILPEKSHNILKIAKGLIKCIQPLEKYTLTTERHSKPTTRFRSAILNAKDPISLLCKDIPRILRDKTIYQCDTTIVGAFNEAITELRSGYSNLLDELKSFLFEEFETTSREDLTERFNNNAEFLATDDLKVLYNNIKDIDLSESRWLERIATVVNESRVPKDWSDNDVADFKLKVRKLSKAFLTVEITTGGSFNGLDGLMLQAFDNVLNLIPTMQERLYMARRLANG